MISKTTTLAKNTYNRSFAVVVSFAIIVICRCGEDRVY
jgi:hypothetical protein